MHVAPTHAPPPPRGDRYFHVFLVNMYCAGLCCPFALHMALHCFPIISNQAPVCVCVCVIFSLQRHCMGALCCYFRPKLWRTNSVNGCFLFWRKLRTRTQYPCNPPPPLGRPSLGDRLPTPPPGRPSCANAGDCKGGGGYLMCPQLESTVCTHGTRSRQPRLRFLLKLSVMQLHSGRNGTYMTEF